MKVEAIVGDWQTVEAEWLVLGVFEGETEPPTPLRGSALGGLIGRLLGSKELGTGVGDLTALYGAAGVSAGAVLVVGLGDRAGFGGGDAFAAGQAASKRLAGKKRGAVAVALPATGGTRETASALVEGLVVGTRGPGLRKSEAARHEFEVLRVILPPGIEDETAWRSAVARGEVVGEAVNLARDLANTPPAEKAPSVLAERARVLAEGAGVAAEVWGLEKARAERFGGLLGVAAGSDEPPAFVVLDYARGGKGPTLALVGKGVTFDSGGLSLKPSASMEDMKADMTGAAVVLATVLAVARLGLPVNLKGYLVLTENMTGGRAMKLGDVLTMRNGKTVEVLNTDAEGRLILADALSYAVEGAPGRVLDLATLTGACLVALGTKVAGLFANDDAFARDVLDACAATGERAWRLPLDDDYKEALKSQVADMKNVGAKWGGAITAAKFLEAFVGDTPWVHLDIAGPSWVDGEGTRDAGGTGCFVRTLVKMLETGATPAVS